MANQHTTLASPPHNSNKTTAAEWISYLTETVVSVLSLSNHPEQEQQPQGSGTVRQGQHPRQLFHDARTEHHDDDDYAMDHGGGGDDHHSESETATEEGSMMQEVSSGSFRLLQETKTIASASASSLTELVAMNTEEPQHSNEQHQQDDRTNKRKARSPSKTDKANSATTSSSLPDSTATTTASTTSLLAKLPSLLYKHGSPDNKRGMTLTAATSRAGGLGNVPVEALEECLQPIVDSLSSMDALVLLGLQPQSTGIAGAVTGRDGVYVHSIHHQIQPPCSAPADPHSSVRYVHLAEIPGHYSMGIFVFPPNARIPLHDHPGMCVISRVLYGHLKRLSLDLAVHQPTDRDWQQMQQLHWQRNYHRVLAPGTSLAYIPTVAEDFDNNSQQEQQDAATREANSSMNAHQLLRHKIDHLKAPNTTILYPHIGNLHEFVAGPQGAAVLDVLLPPYDVRGGRDCTFYEICDCTPVELEWIAGQQRLQQQSTPSGSVSAQPSNQGGAPCWIVPLPGQPPDFHCISGSYPPLKDTGSAGRL